MALSIKSNMTMSTLILIAIITTIAASADWTSFQSRPDIRAPILHVEMNEANSVTPGYIFVAPYNSEANGPFIYDNDGNLVWSGIGDPAAEIYHNLHICGFKGFDHLCFFQGSQLGGYARGENIILDDTYNQAALIKSGHGLMPSDMHEFSVIDNSTAIMPVYQPRPYDLEAYNGPPGLGWVMDGVFQEVNITNNEVLFEWRSLDHIPPSDTYMPLGLSSVVGNGESEATAWDYFHINSIDKNSMGDYLVSARHTSGIYKISGEDGSVKWSLGGKRSSVKLMDYNFSGQHDARFRGENETHTILSIFDNASDGHRTTSPTSSGKIISIDHATNISTLIKQYQAPDGGILSTSQGCLQTLSSGNVFIGWGHIPSISEHTEAGTPVYFATLLGLDAMNYRASKANWSANPIERPALYISSPLATSGTTFWVSWNGATDVRFWNFYAAPAGSDQFKLLSRTDNQGFQTTFTSSDHHSHVFAEALSADGSSLANSSIVML